MLLHLVVYFLVLSIILTNVVVVVSIEPITMTIGAAAVGKHKSAMTSYPTAEKKKFYE